MSPFVLRNAARAGAADTSTAVTSTTARRLGMVVALRIGSL
jgi:hypothetical protein